MLFPLLRRALSAFSFRRADPRRREVVAVDWRLFGSHVHGVSATEDLSRAGAFIRTGEPKPPGTPLVLSLATREGPVDVHARVAWSRPGGMGVRFTRALVADPV